MATVTATLLWREGLHWVRPSLARSCCLDTTYTPPLGPDVVKGATIDGEVDDEVVDEAAPSEATAATTTLDADGEASSATRRVTTSAWSTGDGMK